MKNRITNDTSAITKAIEWEQYLDESKRESWHSTLIDIQREINDIRFANEERPSVAAYGESQMGKSYLIGAMLSDPNIPFSVSDGNHTYDFIKQINPSEDNASIEATGLVTRFHLPKKDEPSLPQNWIKVRMLSVADVVLLLIEAWCNEVIRTKSLDVRVWLDNIEERKKKCIFQACANPILSEVDLAYMDTYLREADSGSGFLNINSSNLIVFLRQNVGRISNEETISLLRLLWDDNKDFNRLFDDLLHYYSSWDFQQTAYVEFESLLKEKGTLLDVERLNEMYDAPSARVDKDKYNPNVTIRFSEQGSTKVVPKPFLSALIAELCIVVDTKFASQRPFLDHFDILDFPGLRPKDEREEGVLGIGDNLATVFRRGKVTYLFKKYARSKRISSLLFCHNHNQSNACKLGPVLTSWVNTNVGDNPEARHQSCFDLGGSPLMIVSTWFNENLKYSDEDRDSNLNSRWETRFRTVLTNQVLKAKNLPLHWFNSWEAEDSPFKSIFLLRSFKFSRATFSGWDPARKVEEQEVIPIPKFPDFLERLKESFVTNSFVRERFTNPSAHWEACATCGNDGTKPIIEQLNSIAPKAEEARAQKFKRDLKALEKSLYDLLHGEYHEVDPSAQTRKAAKEVAKLILSIDGHCGEETCYWSRMMADLMLPERKVREFIFTMIKGNQVSQRLSNPEAEIFMKAGLSTDLSPEENLRLLCEFLYAEDKNECEEILREINPEVKLDRLLSQTTMLSSSPEQIVSLVEQLWLDFLTKEAAIGNPFPYMSVITGKIIDLYKLLEVHKKIVEEVSHIMETLVDEKQVGIVANWITMSLNKFVGEFGYGFMPEEIRKKVMEKNEQYRLKIDAELLEDIPYPYGVALLEQMEEVLQDLEKDSYSSELRNRQMHVIPQYRSRWQWQNRMRVAFAATSGFSDFNPEANDELKLIMDTINPNNDGNS